MVVSVGDLGTDAVTVETNLSKKLSLAETWDAILLLDESDVFLENRSLKDLQRNAMVGVFLRLMEYHHRLIFLTTNRIATFDEAIKSRIAVAIKYPDLDSPTRKTIWKNFLQMAKVEVGNLVESNDVSQVSEEVLDLLASHKLNGREIKNTVRTTQALAFSSDLPLTYGLIREVIDLVAQFDED
jgi:ATPase family associated with various cellular activities (AAA)